MLDKKNIRILLLGLFVVSLLGLNTACSVAEKKPEGPTKAELAEQKRLDDIKIEKEAAEKIAAAKKKAVADEDTVQLKQIQKVVISKAEKLPEEIPGDLTENDELSTPKLDLPTAPNTYLVTVQQKNKTHPYFGQGDKRGFAVNGEQGHYIIAKRGEEITFQVRTGVQHDFYLTKAPKGWGASPFALGVDGQFTYNGNVSFKPTTETPNDLFYGCRNHNAMGGRIVVVDAGADVAAVVQKLDEERKTAEKNAKSEVNKAIKPQKVSQKIAYVGMLLQFKGKSLEANLKSGIQAKLDEAKQLEKAGQLAAAYSIAQEAAAMFAGKAKKTVLSKEEIEEQKEELNDLMITLEAFIDSHKASYEQTKKQLPEKLVDYDHDLVEKLVIEAVQLSTKNQFSPAKKRIRKAERLVTKALNDMLHSQTIVYDLNFETPADEYAYEIKKYESYLELIPVAIEVKKPGKGSIKLMETYVKKGEFFKGKADDAAKAERWKEAMVVLKDAIIEVRRGLRLLGVSM